ncbi:MAG: hypothetical protein FWE23_09100 [Chitinivibrionia bacterium]|nr:hypothetical protein [Chitinivibrionia bacterium]
MEDKEIASCYIKAYIAHREWHEYQMNNMGNVLAINAFYYIRKGLPLVIASIVSLFVGILLEYHRQIFEFFR